MGVMARLAAGAALALGVAVPSPGAEPLVRPLAGIKTWAAYYGAAAESAAALARFDLVALDPGAHPSLPEVKRHGALVVMYVSLGEVNVNHPTFADIRAEPWVLDANPNWPEARRLDVRAAGYRQWLLTRVAAPALAGPVNGLFLDTPDTPIELERENPRAFTGMTAALEEALRALRAAHPRALLVLNGGLPLVERAPGLVDAVAVESIWTDYDFATRRYRPRAAAAAEARAARLGALAARGVTVLTLEYASPTDGAWIEGLVATSRGRGFVPYVATIGLDRVFTFTVR